MSGHDWKRLAKSATYAPRAESHTEGFDASDYERPARVLVPSVPAEIAARARGLQRLVERAPLADWTIEALAPSTANLREHHQTRARRAKTARAAAYQSAPALVRDMFALERPPSGLVVLIVRQAPRALDSDNLASALKNYRDGIADALGVDDRDPRVQWEVAQTKCNVASLRFYVVS
jgi:hypothetical protein